MTVHVAYSGCIYIAFPKSAQQAVFRSLFPGSAPAGFCLGNGTGYERLAPTKIL